VTARGRVAQPAKVGLWITASGRRQPL